MLRTAQCLYVVVLAVIPAAVHAQSAKELLDRAKTRPGMAVVTDAERLERDYAERRRIFEKLERKYPDSRNRQWILLFHAQLLCDMRLHKESEAKFRQAARELKGTDLEPLCVLMAAQAIEYQSDYDKARRAFRDYRQRFPTHMAVGSAARHIVYTLADEGRYEEARELGEKALKDHPDQVVLPALQRHVAVLPLLGEVLPQHVLTTVDGEKITPKDTTGKVTLFFHWFPGGDDVHYAEDLTKARREFDPSELVLIGIVPDDRRKQATALQDEYRLPWRSISLSEIEGVLPPTVLRCPSFILDPQGRLRGVGIEDERLFSLTRRLLDEKSPPRPGR